jgi:hypothetical protein
MQRNGVSRCRNMWRVDVALPDGTSLALGIYPTREIAQAAYDDKVTNLTLAQRKVTSNQDHGGFRPAGME